MPVVQIASPAPDSVYAYGQLVTLEGYGQDFEEGTLADTQLTWHSSLDGELGTGQLLHAELLSVGVHEITLIVTDAAGNEASESVTISIAPTLEIAGPTLVAAPFSLVYQAEAGAENPVAAPAKRAQQRQRCPGMDGQHGSSPGCPWIRLLERPPAKSWSASIQAPSSRTRCMARRSRWLVH